LYKFTNRITEALAKIIIYSISVDSPVSEDSTSLGIAAGSKALDSLKRLITSVESFFHPSNAGPWTVILTSFLNRLASEFYARCKKEETNPSKIPVVSVSCHELKETKISLDEAYHCWD